MDGVFLGLDIGTQSTKALLVDVGAGRVLERASRSYGLVGGLGPGCAEQHPSTWITAITAAVHDLWRARPDLCASVQGIGVSGQQHGLVLLDRDGVVLRAAKLWCDTSTAADADALARELGRPVPTGFTASKVRHAARVEPEVWRRARTVFLPHDYVNFELTGVRACEAGDASGTGYFDPVARRFDAAAMRVIAPELEQRVPPLVASDAVVGTLHARGAEILGLPVGVPVSAGSGDNMMSALGSGACEAGIFVVSLGTSATVFCRADRPVIDPGGVIAPFCDATGAWLPLVCVMNATGVLEEVRTAFAMDHDELTRLAESEPSGSRGVTFVPYLVGERVPDLPRASATLLGLRPGSLAPGVLYRAAIEGIAANLSWGVERFRALGLPVHEARVVGGAARNDLVCRILANFLGAPLTRVAESETAALGAALQAAWAIEARAGGRADLSAIVRVCSSTVGAPFGPESDSAVQETYSRFREHVARLHGVGPGGPA